MSDIDPTVLLDEDEPSSVMIGDYYFELTCYACPEQYDVFIGSDKVAYVRLRHGYLSVEAPDCFDDMVFETSNIEGDGTFYNRKERDFYLKKITKELDKFYGFSNDQ